MLKLRYHLKGIFASLRCLTMKCFNICQSLLVLTSVNKFELCINDNCGIYAKDTNRILHLFWYVYYGV